MRHEVAKEFLKQLKRLSKRELPTLNFKVYKTCPFLEKMPWNIQEQGREK